MFLFLVECFLDLVGPVLIGLEHFLQVALVKILPVDDVVVVVSLDAVRKNGIVYSQIIFLIIVQLL